MDIWISTSFVMSSFAATCGAAGAIAEEESGLRKVAERFSCCHSRSGGRDLREEREARDTSKSGKGQARVYIEG